jgi:hypothetical protein
LSEHNSSKHSHEKSNKVDSQLKLDEFSNAIVDVSSPLASRNDGTEIIIKQNDIGCFLRYIRTSNSHCETNICFTESRCILKKYNFALPLVPSPVTATTLSNSIKPVTRTNLSSGDALANTFKSLLIYLKR